MEEIFETLRKQIKGDFDQNNIIIILDNSISLTCKKHPISGTNNSIIIIQPYLIDIIEKTGIQSISMYEQYQMIAVYQNQIDNILGQISEIEEELELDKDLILLPNFPYINTYLEDYKYLVIYEVYSSTRYTKSIIRLSRTNRTIPIPKDTQPPTKN